MYMFLKEKIHAGFWSNWIAPAWGWAGGAEMTAFTLQLRLLQQRVPQYESGQDVSENQLIAAMRFVTSLEYLRLQQPLLT
ncbi:hypothetical protein UP03_12265, partial [Enterobacter hormaechei]